MSSTIVLDVQDSTITENTKVIYKIDRMIFWILLIFISTMPLIIFGRFEYVTSPLISENTILSSSYNVEIFTHYKFFWTVIVTATILLLFIWKIIKENGSITKTYLNVFCSIFILSIIVSTLFSKTVHTALYGVYDRSDGAIIWVCYIVLFFIALNINLPKNYLDLILYSLIPFVVINFLMIVFNFYGKDFFSFDWFERFLMLSVPEQFTLGESSQILGTLNQWNYMSGMFSMFTVMYIVWALTTTSKLNSIIGTLTASMSMLIVFLAVSISGSLTFLVSLLFIFWIALKCNKKQVALVISTFILICAPLFIIWNMKDERIYKESIGGIVSLFSIGGGTTSTPEKSEEEGYLPVLPEPSVSAGSGRTYIWFKTLDLIAERPILGYGMDTILYHFPHDNIDARAGLRTENATVDKPHNVYLATFYGFGVVGFLCFLFLLGYTIYLLFKSIRIQQWETTTLLMFAFAYFVQAVFNDSLPSMSALTFLFIGISANYFIRQKQIKTQIA